MWKSWDPFDLNQAICKLIKVKRPLIYCLLLALPFGLFAQQKGEDEPNTRSLAFGLYAHTYGFGLDIQHLRFREGNDLFFSLSFASLKNLKEQKIESLYVDQGGKDYYFGKKNYGYTLTPLIGLSRQLIQKSDFNRVSLRINAAVGPSLAIQKPYYLEVAVPFNQTQAIVEVVKYDPTQHNYGNIVGEADYFLGLNELSISPGIRGKLSGNLDFSRSDDYIRGIEFGVNADYYFTSPQLMATVENKNLYIGGMIGILFGNAW